MKLFPLFRTNKQTPEWTYTASGSIWRLLFSSDGNIIGECRNQDQKLTTFFCVDEKTGHVLWEGVKLEEPWWVGIEAVHDTMIFLHEFAKPDLPEHKRIRAIDIESGTLRWSSDELTFWFVHRNKVYAYRDLFEKRVAYALAIETGAVEETYEDGLDQINALRRIALGEQDMSAFLFPEIVQDDSIDSTSMDLINKEISGKTIQGNMEFIKEHKYLLVNYYIPTPQTTLEAPLFENHFSIFNVEQDQKVFSDVLARNAKAPVPDSFFIKGPLVYFIKDQKVLTALRLQQ